MYERVYIVDRKQISKHALDHSSLRISIFMNDQENELLIKMKLKRQKIKWLLEVSEVIENMFKTRLI